jgi:hypothetical protein
VNEQAKDSGGGGGGGDGDGCWVMMGDGDSDKGGGGGSKWGKSGQQREKKKGTRAEMESGRFARPVWR